MSILPKRCWLTTADAARMLQVTVYGVRWLAQSRHLAGERTLSGQWIFRSEDVERAMVQRGRWRVQRRSERLRDVRIQMLKAGLGPRQLALFRRADGERSLLDRAVKGLAIVRKRA